MTRRRSALVVRPRPTALQRLRHARGDVGAATAEYAVVTVAAAGLGGILIKLLSSDWFMDIIKSILETIIRAALAFFGVGG